MTYLYVFIGGGLGACLRYAIGLVYPQHLIWGLPTKTWIANVLGSLLVAIAFSVQKNLPQQSLVEAMVVIGFCGGLTTFSTYILEAYHFILHKNYGSLAFFIFAHHLLAIIVFIIFLRATDTILGVKT